MNRLLRQRHAELFGAALDRFPAPLRRQLEHVDLVVADPLFIGLHRYEDTGDGRSYRDTAHCCYRYHTNQTLELFAQW